MRINSCVILVMSVQRVEELGHAHLAFLGHHKELGSIGRSGETVRVSVGRYRDGHLFVSQQLSATELSTVTTIQREQEKGGW